MTPHPLYSLSFWADALERAVSTAATSAVSVLALGGTDLISAPWYATLSAAGIGGLLDLLRSLGAARGGNPGTAGFTPAIEASGQPTLVARFAARKPDTTG